MALRIPATLSKFLFGRTCSALSPRVVPSLAYSSHLKIIDPDDILGDWYNQLGSRLTISSACDGQLSGNYESEVGDAECRYVMTGRYDTKGRSLGWVVTWNNKTHGSSISTTSWSGQYQENEDGMPEILTTWLLTEQTSPEKDWNSTNVGFGTFTRVPPTPEENQKCSKAYQIGHPKGALRSK